MAEDKDEATEAPEGPRLVRAVWQSVFWGRGFGHEEELELTDLVARTAQRGYLELFDPVTGKRIEPAPPALPKAAARGVRPRAARPVKRS